MVASFPPKIKWPYDHASTLPEIYKLRAYDAIQLAIALEVNARSQAVGMASLGVPALIVMPFNMPARESKSKPHAIREDGKVTIPKTPGLWSSYSIAIGLWMPSGIFSRSLSVL